MPVRGRRIVGRNVVFGAGLLLAAGLVSFTAPAASAADGRAVMLLVDTSGSMAGARLDEAKSALNASIDALPAADSAGLQRYGGDCGDGGSLLVPPGVDNREALHTAVGGLEANGGTPTPDALRAAVANFPASATEKILILVSDGQSGCGDPCPVAKELKAQQGVSFTAFTVGFETTGQAETELSCIAAATGGSYFPASDTAGIQNAISSALGGQNATFKVMSYNVRGDNRAIDRHETGGPTDYSDAIAAQNADVVGLQEINKGETDQVARLLGWANGCVPPYCSWTEVNRLSGEGTAILSRFPMSNRASWKLSPRGGSDHDRFLMRATLTVRGQKLYFYNTHLTTAPEQPEQAKAVLAQIEKDRVAASGTFRPVLVGDMNAKAWDPAGQLLSAALTDSWAKLNPDAGVRTVCDFEPDTLTEPGPKVCGITNSSRKNNYNNPSRRIPTARIDYAFVGKASGYTVAAATVPGLDEPIAKRSGTPTRKYWEVSDHLPLAVTLQTTAINPSARIHVSGYDGRVQEYALIPGGGWAWTDVTRLAWGAVPATGRASSYARGGSVGVVYRSADGRIHQLVQDSSGGWTDQNLSVAAGLPATGRLTGPQRAAGDPQVFLAPLPRIVYRSGDDRVNELSFDGSRWVRSDLTALANVGGNRGAAVRHDPSGYASPAPRVVYGGVDNRVHELFLGQSGWVHADLNTLAGRAADVGGAPTGYLSPSGARVVYRGTDSHVHELFSPTGAGGWRFADLNRLAGVSTTVAEDPAGVATPLATVTYRDSGGQVWQMVQQPSGAWSGQRLPTPSGWSRAASRPGFYVTQFLPESQRVVYVDRRGHLQELRAAGGSWIAADLTELGAATSGAYGAPSPLAVVP
jgi:endonuclease/exonuclease/phosphatase family metal-dependent hydrolase